MATDGDDRYSLYVQAMHSINGEVVIIKWYITTGSELDCLIDMEN